jgi:hypothetical protein
MIKRDCIGTGHIITMIRSHRKYPIAKEKTKVAASIELTGIYPESHSIVVIAYNTPIITPIE